MGGRAGEQLISLPGQDLSFAPRPRALSAEVAETLILRTASLPFRGWGDVSGPHLLMLKASSWALLKPGSAWGSHVPAGA